MLCFWSCYPEGGGLYRKGRTDQWVHEPVSEEFFAKESMEHLSICRYGRTDRILSVGSGNIPPGADLVWSKWEDKRNTGGASESTLHLLGFAREGECCYYPAFVAGGSDLETWKVWICACADLCGVTEGVERENK